MTTRGPGDDHHLLDGLRVVDLSTGIAGPVATRLLAESGADVVKVEPPAGDRGRGTAGFSTWNRSKRSVALDLATDEGRTALDRLLDGADVLVHGLLPSEARRLRLDDGSLARQFPGLVRCAITGYPARHPHGELAPHDTLVLARSGLMDEQRGHRDGPIFIRMPLGSWGAAYLAVAGILSRLLHRRRTGLGGPAHTSLLQGALVPMTMHWARAETPSESFAAGLGKDSPTPLFECADGQWIHLMQCPDDTPMMRKALAEMGERAVARANAEGPVMPHHPNFGANVIAMRQHPQARWLEELWAHDVPAQPVLALGEIFFDEQARANGYVVDVDDPELGPTEQAGIPYRTDPPPAVTRPASRLGEHTGEVLAEDRRPAAIEPGGRSTPARYPLDGLKVLDLGNFLAGPLTPMLLADLGADTIKLETTTGDPMRWVERVFAGCQRNKRGVAVDLKHPLARPVLEALVRWADVVHHNIRMPAARRLGIDEASLRPLNRSMVFCHASSYGPLGPRRDWPGYDQLFQASCGWEREGAGAGNPPMWHRFGMMDHQCALASLVAVLLGLHQREVTGEGQSVASSLLGAALLTTSETCVLADGRLAPYPRLDAEQTGTGPGNRIYRVADGWLAVVASDADDIGALCRAAGVEEAGRVAGALAPRTTAAALVDLRRVGVLAEAVRVQQLDAFFDDSATWQAGLAAAYTHPVYGRTEQIGALWDFGDLDVRLDRASPTIGQHTAEVLRQLGFRDDDVAGLATEGAVAGPGLPRPGATGAG